MTAPVPHVPFVHCGLQTIAGHITFSALHPAALHSLARASKRAFVFASVMSPHGCAFDTLARKHAQSLSVLHFSVADASTRSISAIRSSQVLLASPAGT